MVRIALTGASGHIGGALVRRLLQEKYTVRVLARRDRRAIKDLPVEVVEGDILSPSQVEKLVRDVSVVYHLAAVVSIGGPSRKKLKDVNIEGTRNVVRACREAKISRLIHFSSVHAFEQFPLDVEMNENRPQVGKSALLYDQSKAQGERIAREARKNGLEVVILNPTSIIGPYDFKPSLMGRMLLSISQGRTPFLVRGGFDWVDVRDVAEAAVAAMKRGKDGENYLLSGKWETLSHLARTIDRVKGKKVRRIALPIDMAKLGIPFIWAVSKLAGKEPLYTRDSLKILETSHKKISHRKASEHLGYCPRPLEETIKDLFEWFKACGLLSERRK